MTDDLGEGRIRLLLIDALVLFRSSLGRILSAEADLQVAGECSTAAEALNLFRGFTEPPIDLVLLDFDLGAEHANDFIPAARKAGYQGKFLIVAGAIDVRSIAVALGLGVSGIFLKSDQPQRLVQAIRTAITGDVWVDRTIIQLLANQLVERLPKLELQLAGDLLATREKKALLGIMQGLSNRKIGQSLGISESSAKNIVQHLFALTGVRTRSQLVRLAFEGSLGHMQTESNPEAQAPTGGTMSTNGRQE